MKKEREREQIVLRVCQSVCCVKKNDGLDCARVLWIKKDHRKKKNE